MAQFLKRKSCLAVVALVAWAVFPGGSALSFAGETIAGPVPARVLNVIDGDTVIVRARVWLGQDVEVRVRLEGIDAPEINGRCSHEISLARKARDFVAARVDGEAVTLYRVRYGKYAGRVVARLVALSGEDISQFLLSAGLARIYAGGQRQSWCRR